MKKITDKRMADFFTESDEKKAILDSKGGSNKVNTCGTETKVWMGGTTVTVIDYRDWS